MTPIPEGAIEPGTACPWPDAYQSQIGLMGNTGPMEWVIFQSKTSFDVNDQRENGKESDRRHGENPPQDRPAGHQMLHGLRLVQPEQGLRRGRRRRQGQQPALQGER